MPPANLFPVSPPERMPVLDVLRGFALFGILLMNIEGMAGPLALAITGMDPHWHGADRWSDALVYVLVQGKFYTLFALLFGMGFALMSQRAEAVGRPFAAWYWRRSLVLLTIGAAHALLLWSGDILVSYALLSLLLPAFRRVPVPSLAVMGIALYLAPSLFYLGTGALANTMQADPALATGWQRALAEQGTQATLQLQAQREAYGAGDFAQATAQRWQDMRISIDSLLLVWPQIFGMFLLGAGFVRSGAILWPERFIGLYSALRALLPLGLAMMLGSFALAPTLLPDHYDLRISMAVALAGVANLTLCLGYLAWIVRGLQSPRWSRGLLRLAPAGRMALTNYLLQSLVCTLLFYRYGLGYFERMPRFWQLPFAVVLFLLQVVASRWWLARFRFGPVEWLWRWLTYLHRPPMRGGASSV